MEATKRPKLSASPTACLSSDSSSSMESIPIQNAKGDKKGKQVSQYCLGLPTILRRVLEHFSTRELIQASVVNKLWNFEARSVMKERGNVSANIRHDGLEEDDRCQKLAAFASDLEKMRVVPFSGLKYFMFHRHNCQLISNGPTQLLSYKMILDRLPWKHVSIIFGDDWERCKYCPALVLVRQILEDYCRELEHLTLGFGKERFLRPILQNWSLPRLRSLTLESRESGSSDDLYTSNFIKSLVSCARNLQELHADATAIDLTVDILKGSSAVIVPKRAFRPLLTPICEGLFGAISASEMEINIHRGEFDPGLLNSFIPKLLHASRNTLKTFKTDFLFAVPLMCYGICFENLTELQIHIKCSSLEDIEPSILNLPMGLDCTRLFPKLHLVSIMDHVGDHFSSNIISGFVEEANAVLSRALPDRANNIKYLSLDGCSSLEDSTIPLLAQMFPYVKRVTTKWDQQGCSVTLLQEQFLGLEDVFQYERGKGARRLTSKRGWVCKPRRTVRLVYGGVSTET